MTAPKGNVFWKTAMPHPMTHFLVTDAQAGRMDQVRKLFLEYAAGLKISLCFQGFDQELAGLPGKYAPPDGCILLAMPGDANDEMPAAGCVAVRPMDEPGICEMKRLYVRPEYRGQKLGLLLAEAAVARAREMGYQAMRLDTLSSMVGAIALYERLGFRDIEAYCHNPHPGVRYMELDLGAP
jgi:ribosomal protein S18 acetylase RimI-like enzyme